MSKTITERLTQKFEKDIEKFFLWAVNKNYLISNIDDENIEWSTNLLMTIEFKEPGRNKLEGFIKAIMGTYNITRNQAVMDDPKLIAKDFKETPTEVKEKSPKKEKVVKEVKEKSPKKEKVVKEVKEKSPKKEKVVKEKSSDKEYVDQVKLDMTLDTIDTDYLATLEYWTKDIVSAFGNPSRVDRMYEWKIQVNNSILSIYNNDNLREFNDLTWHVNGSGKNKENDMHILISYIDEFSNRKDIKLDFENLGDSDEDNDDDNNEYKSILEKDMAKMLLK